MITLNLNWWSSPHINLNLIGAWKQIIKFPGRAQKNWTLEIIPTPGEDPAAFWPLRNTEKKSVDHVDNHQTCTTDKKCYISQGVPTLFAVECVFFFLLLFQEYWISRWFNMACAIRARAPAKLGDDGGHVTPTASAYGRENKTTTSNNTQRDKAPSLFILFPAGRLNSHFYSPSLTFFLSEGLALVRLFLRCWWWSGRNDRIQLCCHMTRSSLLLDHSKQKHLRLWWWSIVSSLKKKWVTFFSLSLSLKFQLSGGMLASKETEGIC